MKLNGRMLVVVAMMVGSLSAAGCAKPADASPTQDGASADVSAVTTQGATPSATSPGVDKDANGVRFVRPAPPALRVENPGRAPSAHHVWRRGFWRWDATRVVYVWVPGYWEDTTVVVSFAPPPVRVEDPGLAPSADYVFVQGYWRWDGHDYDWVSGHWERRHEAWDCVRATWVFVDGHWVYRPVHFGDGHDRDGDRYERHEGHDARASDRGDAPRAEAPRRNAPKLDVHRVVAAATVTAKPVDHRAPLRAGVLVRSSSNIPRGHG